MGRYLRTRATTPLVPAKQLAPMEAPAADPLTVSQAEALRRGGSVTVDAGYWRSPGAQPPYQDVRRDGLPLRPAPPALLKDTPHGRFYPELTIDSQNPPWSDPPFWAKPLEETFTCPGVPWYVSWSTVHTMQVPDSHIIRMQGLAFQWGNIPIGDVFEFQIEDSGLVLGRVQSMRIANPANPAFQYAIGGPQRYIPFPAVFDRSHTIVVRARNLGPQNPVDSSFSKTDSDPFGQPVTTTLIGWRAPLIDTRNGGPIPGDVFPITDGVPVEPRYDPDYEKGGWAPGISV